MVILPAAGAPASRSGGVWEGTSAFRGRAAPTDSQRGRFGTRPTVCTGRSVPVYERIPLLLYGRGTAAQSEGLILACPSVEVATAGGLYSARLSFPTLFF